MPRCSPLASPVSRSKGPTASQLVYFPLAPGALVLAYQQTAFTTGPGDWLTVVDASNGTVLWRKNIRSYASTQDARFSVYVQADGKTPADSPAPQSPTGAVPGAHTQFPAIARAIVNMSAVQDLIASPDGWIPDGATTTTGNNVDACVDRVAPDDTCDAGTLDNNGRPVPSAIPILPRAIATSSAPPFATSTTTRHRSAAIPRPAIRRPARACRRTLSAAAP